MQLSVIIPAYNEEEGQRETVVASVSVLDAAAVPHEILIVNDHSADSTERVYATLQREVPTVCWDANEKPGGFGYAIRTGLEQFQGDAACIVMADASDDPNEVLRY